jgi:bifunctional non-homologous end joining protein LigD
VYSLRAKTARPFVSLPLTWQELQTAVDKANAANLYFAIDTALDRVTKLGDFFKPILSLKQQLPSAVLKHLSAKTPRSLRSYASKRDFAKTKEPAPVPLRRSQQGSRRRFVIQKHAASHLHYDFRLEMHDVLKSWALPKGPPYSEGEKRLAMPTEDHPFDYVEFEGIIPKGQYGGGTVMVWDIGTYELLNGNYYKGYVHVHLNGQKLKGEWSLIRGRKDGERDQWYLMKVGASMRAMSKKRDDTSALSNRSMQQIERAADATWQSNRAHTPAPDASDLPKAKLGFVEPMLAKLVHDLPAGSQWQYELKLDGYRALASRTKRGVTLYSRRGNEWNNRFPSLVDALSGLPNDTIVDGEIIVLDDTGKPSFNALQNLKSIPPESLRFYLFDIVAWRGSDVRSLPLADRRNILENLAQTLHAPVMISEVFAAGPEELIRATKKAGLEGIVAKRRDSRYEAGERSGAWVKYKADHAQEFVIGGYKPGKYGFEYLLAGYYEGTDLIFVAKIKNGFVPQVRRDVAGHFDGLESTNCPFANLPEPKNARRGEAITADVMKKIRWLKPQLIAQVAFTEWTSNNHLRHSRFIALRDDKPPQKVTRETAA